MEPLSKVPRKDDSTVDHLNEHGFMYLDAKDSSLQTFLARLLKANYTHVSKKKRGYQISGGKTLQTKVDWYKPTIGAAILQIAMDMLLDRVEESVYTHFGSERHKLRITNCSFVMTKGDTKGQIPHCDALATNFLTGLVYLSDGTRGTEYWPQQNFPELPRDRLFDTDVDLLRKIYGEAVRCPSDELLDNLQPVREHVSFGDILIFSPSLLHRGPPSVEERLCFFFSIEREGGEGGLYDADAQNTIDDIAMRCFHFDTDAFLTCHDDWLTKQGFSMNYGEDIGPFVNDAHAEWKAWVAEGKPEPKPNFFNKEGTDILTESYQCW
jgi:hypothetical protein